MIKFFLQRLGSGLVFQVLEMDETQRNPNYCGTKTLTFLCSNGHVIDSDLVPELFRDPTDGGLTINVWGAQREDDLRVSTLMFTDEQAAQVAHAQIIAAIAEWVNLGGFKGRLTSAVRETGNHIYTI